jgi:hypothetical protein
MGLKFKIRQLLLLSLSRKYNILVKQYSFLTIDRDNP